MSLKVLPMKLKYENSNTLRVDIMLRELVEVLTSKQQKGPVHGEQMKISLKIDQDGIEGQICGERADRLFEGIEEADPRDVREKFGSRLVHSRLVMTKGESGETRSVSGKEFTGRVKERKKPRGEEGQLSPEGVSYTVWTDGGCTGNPGPGGWGIVVEAAGSTTEASGYGGDDVTNQQMELQAAIEGVKRIPEGGHGKVYSDSQYVVKGMNEWVPAWRMRGWRKADGKAVLNRERWEALVAESEARTVKFEWIRGHSGNAGNERADRLATQAIRAGRGG